MEMVNIPEATLELDVVALSRFIGFNQCIQIVFIWTNPFEWRG